MSTIQITIKIRVINCLIFEEEGLSKEEIWPLDHTNNAQYSAPEPFSTVAKEKVQRKTRSSHNLTAESVTQALPAVENVPWTEILSELRWLSAYWSTCTIRLSMVRTSVLQGSQKGTKGFPGITRDRVLAGPYQPCLCCQITNPARRFTGLDFHHAYLL